MIVNTGSPSLVSVYDNIIELSIDEMLQELPPIPDSLRGDPVPPGVKRVVEKKRREVLAEMRGTPYALPLARAASINLLDEAMIAAYIITPRHK